MRRRTREAGWHTDVTFMATPPAGSVLSARVVPAAGGDTLWADSEAAYDALDEPLRRLVDGLRRGPRRRAAPSAASSTPGYAVEWDGERSQPSSPIEHPVVRTHPETGRRSLFVNPQFTSHVVGLSARHSEALLDLLYHHMTVARAHRAPPVARRRRRLLGQPLDHALRHPRLRRRPPRDAPRDPAGRPAAHDRRRPSPNPSSRGRPAGAAPSGARRPPRTPAPGPAGDPVGPLAPSRRPATGRAAARPRAGRHRRRHRRRPPLWSAVVRHDPDGRRPVRLIATERYEVWVIGWTTGQHVGVHDHGDSAGAFVVTEGELTEVLPDGRGGARSNGRWPPAGSATSRSGTCTMW